MTVYRSRPRKPAIGSASALDSTTTSGFATALDGPLARDASVRHRRPPASQPGMSADLWLPCVTGAGAWLLGRLVCQLGRPAPAPDPIRRRYPATRHIAR